MKQILAKQAVQIWSNRKDRQIHRHENQNLLEGNENNNLLEGKGLVACLAEMETAV